MSAYDVVVAGGGHNGLACAAYIAREGKRVLVVEQRDIVGGFCTTEETVPEAPGFKMSRFAAELSLGTIPPTVDDELDLAREGLQFVWPDPFYAYVNPEGKTIGFWRDVNRTIEDIAQFSRRDAESYREFNAALTGLWETMVPYMTGHPTRIPAKTLLTMVGKAAKRKANLKVANRILLSSPGAVIEEWFESDELRAAMGVYSVSALASLDAPGSGLVMAMMSVKHKWGMRRPVGGAGAYTAALAACIRRHGGEVRVSAPVASVDVANGRTTGVTLESGEQIRAETVIASMDPWTLGNRLLPAGSLPDRTYRELRGMSVIGNNISVFKADIAVSERPKLVGGQQDRFIGSTMLFAPSLEYVRAATANSSRGELGDEVPMWVAAPSAYDRSAVPPGSRGEGLYVYLPSVPYELTDTNWDKESRPFLDQCIDILAGYLPDVKNLMIGSTPTSPADLEEISKLHKGSLFHVDPSLSQFGPSRPIPSFGGYHTPIENLMLTGAGSHPTGTVSGWPGRSTAREYLRGSRAGGRRALLRSGR